MDSQLKSLGQVENTIADMAIRFGPKVLAAAVIVLAGLVAARWVGRATERGLGRLALEPPVRLLLVRLVRIIVLALFAIIALQNLGVELLPLIAGLSVVGAGLALATQGVLGNAVAGLTIIFTKPYRVGEFIAIVGVEGAVEEITLFSTVLAHPDRSKVVVPNRKIVGEILHNHGRIRQTQVSVGVAFGADLGSVLSIVGDVVRANPRVLADPAPVIQIAALSAAVVQISAKPWVAAGDYGVVETELNLNIVDAIRRRSIPMPQPQMDVRLLGSPPAGPGVSAAGSG